MINFLSQKFFFQQKKIVILFVSMFHISVFAEIIDSPIIYLKHGQLPIVKNNFEFCGLIKTTSICVSIPSEYAYSENIFLDNSNPQNSFCGQIDFKLYNGEILFKNKEFPRIKSLTTCTFVVESEKNEEYQKLNLHFNYFIEDWASELGNGTEAQRTAVAILKFYKSNNKNQVMDEIINYRKKNIWQNFKELLGFENSDTLNLENEYIRDLSPILALKKLKYLKLQNNMIDYIPDSIVELSSLKVLDISYNNFKYIPEVLLRLRNIEYVDIAYNQIDIAPAYILKSQKFNKVFYGLLENVDSNGDPIVLDKVVNFTPISTEKRKVRDILYRIINEKSKEERRKKIESISLFGKYPAPLIPFDNEMIENLNLSARKNLFYIWEHKNCKQLFLRSYSRKKEVIYEYLGNYFDLDAKLPYQCFHEENNPVKYKLKVLQNSVAKLDFRDSENTLKEQSLFLRSIWGDVYPYEAFQQKLLYELNMNAYATYGLNAPQYLLRCQEDICSLYLSIQEKDFLLSTNDY